MCMCGTKINGILCNIVDNVRVVFIVDSLFLGCASYFGTSELGKCASYYGTEGEFLVLFTIMTR